MEDLVAWEPCPSSILMMPEELSVSLLALVVHVVAVVVVVIDPFPPVDIIWAVMIALSN